MNNYISLEKIYKVYDNQIEDHDIIVGESNDATLKADFFFKHTPFAIFITVEMYEVKKRRLLKDIKIKRRERVLTFKDKEAKFIKDSDWKHQGSWIKDFKDYIDKEYDLILEKSVKVLSQYDKNYNNGEK